MSDETKRNDVEGTATAVADGGPEDATKQAAGDLSIPERQTSGGKSGANGSLLERLELPVEVRFGKLAWNLKRLLELRVGDAVPVGRDGDDVVTLYVQGRPFGTGELVVINGRFGFRVIEILDEGGPR